MITTYLPKNASAMIAPKNGRKYTADVNIWYQYLASSSVIGAA